MQSAGDIDWVHHTGRIPALVRAVWHKVRDDTGPECFRMDICRQIVHRAVETGVFPAFVPCCKYVFSNGVFLFIVNDSLAVKSVVAHVLKFKNF